MSDMKQLFLELLDFDHPDGVALFATTAIPDLANIATPTTASEAIIAQGVLAANINTILKAFVGLTPVDLVLRSGGRNPLLKALVMASYEFFGSLTEESFTKLKATLVRIKSRSSGLIGQGTLTPEDKADLNTAKAELQAQLSHPALDANARGLIGNVIFAIEEIFTTAEENFDAACEAIVNNIDAALSVFQ